MCYTVMLINLFVSYVQGLISQDKVNDCVSHLFIARMKLGEFDPPELNPYSKYVSIATTLDLILSSFWQMQAEHF